MPYEPSDEFFQQARDWTNAAERLLARGRLREAVDALNRAIALAPEFSRSYALRADAFERLGMQPQAEADRQRAQEMGGAYPEPEEPAAPVAKPRKRPAARAPRASAGGLSSGLIVLVGAFVALAGATIAGGLALVALTRDDTEGGPDTSVPPGAASPTPDGATAGATPTPRASLPPGATTGSPFSLASFDKGMEAKGIGVQVGGGAEGFSGFAVGPSEVTLMRGGGTAELAVLVYKNTDAPAQDWTLMPGSRPEAKSGRTLPSHISIWWNANMIVVVRSDSGGITVDGLDAFLNLAP